MHPRHIAQRLADALADTPVVLLNGARQTGKSTLAQTLAEPGSRRYLTLDDPAVLAAARHDPAGFIQGLSGPVVLDEVQRAPEIFLPIKAAVDRDRTPGRFLLTGSANVLLLPQMADSLAGRMEILSLWPLSSAERSDQPAQNRAEWLVDGGPEHAGTLPCPRPALIDTLVRGGFPEAAQRATASRRRAWFDSYLQAVMQRDVQDLARVEQLQALPSLLQLLALRSGGLLNFAELSRASGLQQTTLKRYFALLETLFLVHRLLPWERNAGKRLVKTPKVYLPDSGLLAHLTGQDTASLDSALGLPGALIETWVLTELLKHLAFSDRGLTLWHYRTQAGQEVDFVLETRQGGLTGIEVKAAVTLGANDFKGLRHLQETEPERFQRGYVLYAGQEVVPFGAGLWGVPLAMWWAALTAPSPPSST